MNAIKRTFGFIHTHPLAKRHLFRAYFNFIIWQIRSRISHNFLKVRFINSTHILAKRGLTGVSGNIYTGLHDFNDMGLLLHFLRPEDVFFDVGANIGSYTLLASSVCKAKSISFEPIPSTFKILEDNIKLNKIEHLATLVNKGVGKGKGLLKFSTQNDTTNHVIAEHENTINALEVEVIALDEYAFAQPSLIKIDVEGFETEVLNGASTLLANTKLKALIIELIDGGKHYGFDETNIHEKLLSNSFKPYDYNPLDRTFKEIPTFGASNTLYLRDLNFIENRVKTANPFKVFNQTI